MLLIFGGNAFANRSLALKPDLLKSCYAIQRCFNTRTKARPSPSSKGTKMKRYNVPSHCIGLVKSWDSKHTGGLKGSYWAHERFADDIMIRKFVEGTFYDMLTSDVIIKRRLNSIIVAMYISGRVGEQKPYFMKAFAEKILSEMLGCVVSVELRTGPEFI